LTIPQQIESDTDDPRTFQDTGPPFDGGAAAAAPGLENFFSTPNLCPAIDGDVMYLYRYSSTYE